MAVASGPGPASGELSPADDKWQVALAPGEIKTVNLEQLDDLFRLEIIDGDTKVRRLGDREWLPLSVVAEIDEPAPAAASAEATPRVAAVSKAPEPLRAAPATAAGASLKSASPTASQLASTSAAPAPVPAARAPVVTSTPPLANGAPSALVTSASPSAPPVPGAAPTTSAAPSAPPVTNAAPNPFAASRAPALSEPLLNAAPASMGRRERWLIGIAAVLGLGLTLYRNDLLRDLAATAGQKAAYGRFEEALGGPPSGTPRAIEAITGRDAPMMAAPMAATPAP